MPTLTRKRVNDRPETWHIRYAGVSVGMILERSGVAKARIRGNGVVASTPAAGRERIDTDRATNFDAARAGFEAAWREYLPTRTEADFQE